MIYGPNGQARAGGVMAWLEICARYSVEAVARMIESGVASMDCCEDVCDEYNKRMDLALKDCIWDSPVAKSYYINEFGRQNTNMPWLPHDYYNWTRHPNFTDYEVHYLSQSTT
jgi:4-hydroxyacetophenone monooxygenase